MANLETKKVYISLPNEVYVTLESLAKEQGRTTSNLGAFAIEYFLGSIAPKMYPLNRTVKNYEPNDEED